MIRNFFKAQFEGGTHYTGEGLNQELRLTEPMVRKHAATPDLIAELTVPGALQYNEVVLEPPARRCRDLGCV
jgi:hypothetical protein